MHCDLKLENILLNYDDDSFQVRDLCISDFGLSHRIKKRSTNGDGAVFGTTSYMAPEMFYLDSTFDGKIDAWALGVILYELLTFESPFPGKCDEEIATSILDDEIDFVENEALAGVSIEAIDLVESLLQKDPDQRLSVDQIKTQSWLLSAGELDVKIKDLAYE